MDAMSVQVLGAQVCAQIHRCELDFSLGSTIKVTDDGLRVVSGLVGDRSDDCSWGLLSQLLLFFVFFDDGCGCG